MAVLALGSTGCGKSFSSSTSADERLEFDRSRLVPVVLPVSARCRAVSRDEMDPRWRTEAYRDRVSIGRRNIPGSRRLEQRHTALGRCSMPTLKSHRHIRRSSPTLPNR